LTDAASIRPDTTDMACVHKVFRDALSDAPELVTGAAGDAQRRALVANYYANLTAFLEVHHEGEEQLVFPLLAERAPEHKALVDTARTEHEDVLRCLHAANDQLASWQAKGDSEAPATVCALQDLAHALVPHLDAEESEIVPLCGEHMSLEEWGALPGHAMANFRGDKVWLIMGLIRENFSQAQRDAMLEHMPPPAREMWGTIGEKSFTELISVIRV
jgi:hypothetical protein